MAAADELMQQGADAYAAGDFAAAQAAWEAAAALGHDGAVDALRLVAHGDARRQVLWGRMAERDNANALWSLGVAAVERVDLPAVRANWAQAADLDPALAEEVAGLLDCPPETAAATLRDVPDAVLAAHLGALCRATGREETARVWLALAADDRP